MNITIFGAAGGIGRFAVKHAVEHGYKVTAYVRNPEKLKQYKDQISIITGELNDYDSMYNAVKGSDAVVWCVGINMKRKYDNMYSLEGHKVLIEVMHNCNVKRLIDWATPSIPFYKDKKSFITTIPGILAGIFLTQAKKEMYEICRLIENSDLDWTIVRFIAPTNQPYTGNIKAGFGDIKMNMRISREDIASFMIKQITDKEYIKSMPIIGS